MDSVSCIFCKIVKKEIPAKVVFEDDEFIAFNDVKPVSPVHVLVIPKKHHNNLLEIESTEALGKLMKKVQQVAKELNLNDGFRTIINTGDNGGQTVHHLHVHVLGGRFHKWPPG
ncbi:MAG: histidine triad nucleotide-binding protein [Candidatus Melainabacteria bacterium]|nr:histidine triad nucleotide-binding protein [Candidatus Melainabacteria bacterium]